MGSITGLLLILFVYHLYVTQRFKSLQDQINALKGLRSTTPTKSTSMYGSEFPATVAELEAKSAEQNVPEPVGVPPIPSPMVASTATTSSAFTPQAVSSPHFEPSEPIMPEWWTSQSILTKVGAVLVLISMGSFLSYAIVSGWIGPVAQIALGLFMGIVIFLFGAYRIEEKREQGAVFVALGTGIILLSTLVGLYKYEIISPLLGVAILWLPIVGMAYLSIKYRYEPMAVFCLMLAAFVPTLLADAEPNTLGLLSYLAIVSLGAFAVAMAIGSRVLMPLSIVTVALWTFGLFGQDNWLVFIAVNAFVLMFTVGNMFAVLHEKAAQYSSYVFTASISAVWLLLWIADMLPEKAGVPMYLAWATFFVGGAYTIAKVMDNRLVPRVYAGVSAFYIVVATFYLFEGVYLVLILAAEFATMILTYLRGIKAVPYARRLLFVYLLPCLMALSYAEPNLWYSGFSKESTIVLLGMSALTFILGWQFMQYDDAKGKAVFPWLFGGSAFYLNLLMYLALSHDVLTVLWLFEAGIVSVVILRVYQKPMIARLTLLALSVPCAMSATYFTSLMWQQGVIHSAFFVVLATVMVLLSVAVQFALYDNDEKGTVPQVLYTGTTFFAAALIWLTLHAVLSAGIATMVALIIYTAFGLLLYIGGLRTGDNFAKNLGLVAIGCVVGRLLLIEVWQLSTALRIIVFMVIGLMLLSTAFLKGKKLKEVDGA